MAHLPTALEAAPNLGRELDLDLWVKRDDCTGVGFGGNKVRQLEFYLGEAVAQKADTVLITGAVQSNFVRTTAAMARRLGMECHIQLEERVSRVDELYRSNGNVLLDRIYGAHLRSYPDGEDEVGADVAIRAMADDLRAVGRTPYVIPLAAGHAPLGALGYVRAAMEIADQLVEAAVEVDDICVASGSAMTHGGLLFGLRAIGDTTPVMGVCVRRDAAAQTKRVTARLDEIADLLGTESAAGPDDVRVVDHSFAPGYGRLNQATIDAVAIAGRTEALLLDPVYTGRAMAGLMAANERQELAGRRVLFVHTGGQPAVFAYGDKVLGGPEIAAAEE